jgi:hypothetical protein
VPSGGSVDVCVRVTVPSVADGTTDHATITATSVADGSVSGSAAINTIAVTFDTLLVDNDNNAPDVKSYYQTALNATWYVVQHLGPVGGQEPGAELHEGASHHRVVHRYQLPRSDYAVRDQAQELPRRRRKAVHVGLGHPGPGGRNNQFRARLPAHQLGWHGESE